MKSIRDPHFKELFAKLPVNAQKQAVECYLIFRGNPYYPSLHFKEIGNENPPVYSVRIGRSYRALGQRVRPDTIIWLWIGTHEEYNKLFR